MDESDSSPENSLSLPGSTICHQLWAIRDTPSTFRFLLTRLTLAAANAKVPIITGFHNQSYVTKFFLRRSACH
jgi:hypothetical protein